MTCDMYPAYILFFNPSPSFRTYFTLLLFIFLPFFFLLDVHCFMFFVPNNIPPSPLMRGGGHIFQYAGTWRPAGRWRVPSSVCRQCGGSRHSRAQPSPSSHILPLPAPPITITAHRNSFSFSICTNTYCTSWYEAVGFRTSPVSFVECCRA